jgi:hypothetical protein
MFRKLWWLAFMVLMLGNALIMARGAMLAV